MPLLSSRRRAREIGVREQYPPQLVLEPHRHLGVHLVEEDLRDLVAQHFARDRRAPQLDDGKPPAAGTAEDLPAERWHDERAREDAPLTPRSGRDAASGLSRIEVGQRDGTAGRSDLETLIAWIGTLRDQAGVDRPGWKPHLFRQRALDLGAGSAAHMVEHSRDDLLDALRSRLVDQLAADQVDGVDAQIDHGGIVFSLTTVTTFMSPSLGTDRAAPLPRRRAAARHRCRAPLSR